MNLYVKARDGEWVNPEDPRLPEIKNGIPWSRGLFVVASEEPLTAEQLEVEFVEAGQTDCFPKKMRYCLVCGFQACQPHCKIPLEFTGRDTWKNKFLKRGER